MWPAVAGATATAAVAVALHLPPSGGDPKAIPPFLLENRFPVLYFSFSIHLDPYQPAPEGSKIGSILGPLFEPILTPKWPQNLSKKRLNKYVFWDKFLTTFGCILWSKPNQNKPRWPPKAVQESRHSDIERF